MGGLNFTISSLADEWNADTFVNPKLLNGMPHV